MKRIWRILFIATTIFIVGCAKEIELTENDHNMFPLRLADRDNHVIYAVSTDGRCGITNVFPYWKMDDEDGQLEDLLPWERGIYGVEDLRRISETQWNFTIAKLPEKVVEATVISRESKDKQAINCDFVGIALVSQKKAVISRVQVENDGNDVSGLYIYGSSVTDAEQVEEFILPP